MMTRPISSARARLWVAVSMKSAGRKRLVSMAMPESPGRMSSSAASTARVTSRVLAPGNFWITSMRLGPLSPIASPISG